MFDFHSKAAVSDSCDRLQRILKNDKLKMPLMIEDSLRRDILKAISGYVVIAGADFDLRVEIAENGKVLIAFEGIGQRLKCNH